MTSTFRPNFGYLIVSTIDPCTEVLFSEIYVQDSTASATRAAISILGLRRPARMVIAVPVASRSSVLELRAQFDEVVTYSTPNRFETVSQWYDDFAEISEESVRDLYEQARGRFS